MRGPEPAERSEPRIDLLKRFWFQPVKAALCVDRGLDESGLSQHSQMLRNRGLRYAELLLDFSDRMF